MIKSVSDPGIISIANECTLIQFLGKTTFSYSQINIQIKTGKRVLLKKESLTVHI